MSSVLYIKLIRVDPSSTISSDLNHLANLVDMLEKLVKNLGDYNSISSNLYVYYVNEPISIFPFTELRCLYDSTCHLYTSVSHINDAFDTLYEIINEYDDETMYDLCNRLVKARDQLNINCNDLLTLMRKIERVTYGYDFFTNRMPNFWIS